MAVDGQLLLGVSDWRYPHFQIKNNLLYQVSRPQGELREVLLLPQWYVGNVLQLAHTHLLWVHLGMEKNESPPGSTGRDEEGPGRLLSQLP